MSGGRLATLQLLSKVACMLHLPFLFPPQYYNENVRRNPSMRGVNVAANKTKAVAWFVSNCGARNGRLAYAKELQKYIQV